MLKIYNKNIKTIIQNKNNLLLNLIFINIYFVLKIFVLVKVTDIDNNI